MVRGMTDECICATTGMQAEVQRPHLPQTMWISASCIWAIAYPFSAAMLNIAVCEAP